MGARGSKDYDSQSFPVPAGLEEGMSKEQLATYLSSLSDMAQTGVGRGLPEGRTGKPPQEEIKPKVLQALPSKRRKQLQKRMFSEGDETHPEYIKQQLELLESLGSQEDDTNDWASMRSWMVWCLREHLNDEDAEADTSDPTSATTTPRASLLRQFSLDSSRRRLTNQGSLSFESDRDGQMSNQKSFDSTGAAADT